MAYGVIYKITNLVNGKVYIGQTKQGFQSRYSAAGNGAERVYKYHESLRAHGHAYNTHLLNSFERYGVDSFTVDEAFDTAESAEELNQLETMYIHQFRSNDPDYGYNGDDGGDSQIPNSEAREKMRAHMIDNNPFRGKHHSETTRRYLSAVKRGKMTGANNPNYGKKWDTEKRAALSRKKIGQPSKMKGQHVAEWVREKNIESHKDIWSRIPHPMLGKRHSDISKQKIRDSKMGMYEGASNPNAKPVICITTGETFSTVNDAAHKYGICPSGISNVLHGKRAHAGRTEDGKPMSWEFVR